MKRRTFFLYPAALFLLSCGQQKKFDISWVEEVAIGTDEIIAVNVRHVYEQRGSGSKTLVLLRDTEISFQPKGEARITQYFVRQMPMRLDKINGQWIVIIEQVSGLTGAESGQDWGGNANMNEQRVIAFNGQKFVPSEFEKIPDERLTPNMMIWLDSVDELKTYDGSLISLSNKKEILAAHPLDAAHRDIYRPIGHKQ